MADVDEFAQTLFEEAKRFLEKASVETKQEGTNAYLHAALNLGFSAFEAHINAIADDFLTRSELEVLEKSILSESGYSLRDGEYQLTGALKMYRLEDRIQFIYRRFSGKVLDKSSPWWSSLQNGLKLRNQLTHPKEAPRMSKKSVEEALQAIIDTLDVLYKSVYHTTYPVARRGLDSTLTF